MYGFSSWSQLTPLPWPPPAREMLGGNLETTPPSSEQEQEVTLGVGLASRALAGWLFLNPHGMPYRI